MKFTAKIVAIGGGSGLSTLLRGIKHYPAKISAIVTMADNGYSSGRLNREFGILPPGDVRQCLAALAENENLMTKLFSYRFQNGVGINGHSLGNLLLLALSDLTGNFEQAIHFSSQILAIKGEVIPSTLEHVSLVGQLKNGQMALGEKEIPIMGHRFGLEKIMIIPDTIKANPKTITAIDQADIILIGPGSLYTSVIPNLLINDISHALCQSQAKKYYLCNVSTERGETENFKVEDHVEAILTAVPRLKLDGIIVNNHPIKTSRRAGRLGAINNLTTDLKNWKGIPIIAADIISQTDPLYHDANKLGQFLWRQIIAKTDQAKLKAGSSRIVK